MNKLILTTDSGMYPDMNIYENDFCVIGNLHSKNVSLDQISQYLDDLKYFKRIIIQDVGTVVAPYGCDDLCGISLVRKKEIA